MSECMATKESLDHFIDLVPGLSEYLVSGASEESISKLQKKLGKKYDMQELVSVLKITNGEDTKNYVNLIGGLGFLDAETIIREFKYLHELEEEFTAMGTNAIKEDATKKVWVPIAFDSSRCYVAIDYTPAKEGKVGQIITIDMDYNQCYLLANSLAELFDRFSDWYQKGILLLDEDKDYPSLKERSGHLFNSLESLAILDSVDEEWVMLTDEYWLKRYEKSVVIREDGSKWVSTSVLAKEKKLLIQKQNISCTVFPHMVNLKELIIHDATLTDVSQLGKIPELKTMIFARCYLVDGDMSIFLECESLKTLRINVMSAKGLPLLEKHKSLKELQVRAVTEIELKDLEGFTKLQELTIESMQDSDVSFIANMKGLKKLEFDRMKLDNVDFLASLSKLQEFTLYEKSTDEKGLLAVKNMSKLQSFIYPVNDLSIYEGLPCITKIGLDPEVSKGFEVLKGSKVDGFTVVGKISDEQMKKLAMEIGKYVCIRSYGSIRLE